MVADECPRQKEALRDDRLGMQDEPSATSRAAWGAVRRAVFAREARYFGISIFVR
jgi:hypothetical protein